MYVVNILGYVLWLGIIQVQWVASCCMWLTLSKQACALNR